MTAIFYAILLIIGQASATEPAKRIPPHPCHAVQVAGGLLPDRACTPGAVDPAVTQDNIHQTICVAGYTDTVRPPTSYTSPLKLKSMVLYGDVSSPFRYEFDHLIPLELGGAPRDPLNLWPEFPASFNPKDAVEGRLKRAVCSGQMLLVDAQTAIATDWTHA